MGTQQADDRRRRDRKILLDAAEFTRKQARRQQAENAVERGPIVPVSRYAFVGLLDDLAYNVDRLPPAVRKSALTLAGKILDSTDAVTSDEPPAGV